MEFSCDTRTSIVRKLCVDLVDEPHELTIILGDAWLLLIVEDGSGETEELALFCDGKERMFQLDEFAQLVRRAVLTSFFLASPLRL